MKKFLITESEKNDIRRMYGLIKEQGETRCDQWKNATFKQGDGVTTPKITITKTSSLIEGLYEGPDNGGCIQRSQFNDQDTPHQLAGITVYYEGSPYLKQLYNQGIYVKPDMNGITMERTVNNMFKISIPLIKTTEDKAVTSINERGGMGHGGDLTEIDNIQNDPNNKLIERVKKKVGDMTETFICFRNITNFPIKSQPNQKTRPNQQPNQPTGTISATGDDLNSFRDNIKSTTSGKTLDLSTIKLDMDNLTFSVQPGNTQIYVLALRFNMTTDLRKNKAGKEEAYCPACENTISKNQDYGAKSIKSGNFENDTRMYSLIALYPKQ
jgi:hypothetical protein